MPVRLEDYATKFQNIRFERNDGILQMTLHTDGGSLRWGAPPVAEMQEAFANIAADPENRILILTGSGDEFNGPRGSPETFPKATARGWEFAHYSTRHLLMNFLDIECPVIAAINGPAWRHCETPLLADIVLASETAAFQDSGHFVNGLVPGDGMQVVLPMLLGPNRARYFMLTGQVLSATEAKDLGLVAEILPKERLLDRAWELARQLARQSPLVLRYTRVALVHELRQKILAHQGYGVMLEGMAAIDDSAKAGYVLEPRV